MFKESENRSIKSAPVVDFSRFTGGPRYRIALRMGLDALLAKLVKLLVGM